MSDAEELELSVSIDFLLLGIWWWFDQVSLRGASAREISRDALLEKLSQERELRSYVRRANAASLFIQVKCTVMSKTEKL